MKTIRILLVDDHYVVRLGLAASLNLDPNIEVVAELVRGNSNKEIATNLDISDNTVKLHITHIMQKLGAKDRTHAASIALQRGIVER